MYYLNTYPVIMYPSFRPVSETIIDYPRLSGPVRPVTREIPRSQIPDPKPRNQNEETHGLYAPRNARNARAIERPSCSSPTRAIPLR